MRIILLSVAAMAMACQSRPEPITKEDVLKSQVGILKVKQPDTSLTYYSDLEYEVSYADLPAIHKFIFSEDTLTSESINFEMKEDEEAEKAKQWLIDYFGQPDSVNEAKSSVEVDGMTFSYTEKTYYITSGQKQAEIRMVDWLLSDWNIYGTLEYND